MVAQQYGTRAAMVAQWPRERDRFRAAVKLNGRAKETGSAPQWLLIGRAKETGSAPQWLLIGRAKEQAARRNGSSLVVPVQGRG